MINGLIRVGLPEFWPEKNLSRPPAIPVLWRFSSNCALFSFLSSIVRTTGDAETGLRKESCLKDHCLDHSARQAHQPLIESSHTSKVNISLP